MLLPDHFETLKKHSILKLLSEADFKNLINGSELVELKSGEVLFEEGTSGDAIYFITQGAVQIYKKNKTLAIREPSEFIGEMSLIRSYPRAASAKSVADSILIKIPKSIFNLYIIPHPEIVLEILKAVATRTGEDLDALDRGYQDLRRSKEIYKEIVENVSDIILRVSPDRIITFANPAVSILGNSPQDMIGQRLEEFIIADNKFDLDCLLTRRTEPRSNQDLEVWMKINKNSSIYNEHKALLFLVNASGIWDVPKSLVRKKSSQKLFLGSQFVAKEITSRKEYESKLLENQISLENLVEKKTQELETTHKKLKTEKLDKRMAGRQLILAQQESKEAHDSRNKFFSKVNHELRTPLNAVLGFGQLLAQNSESNLSELEESNVQRILKAGNHLLDMINQMLALSAADANQADYQIESCSLQEILDETLGLLQPFLEKHNIKLNISEASDIRVLVDATELKQVLVNLISNGINFNRNNFEINLSGAITQKETIQIEVSSAGEGIPSEELESIFEPFHEIQPGTFDNERVRMSLALCKKLMESMGGTLKATRHPGKGNCFTLELPQG